MSWLRDHFHNFVFPAFMAAEKKSTEIGEPFHVEISPHAPEKLPSELRKLWTLCAEHEVPWEYDVREVNLHGGSSKYREKAKVDHSVLNCTLDSAMAAMRQEGCDRLFLGGRDVWAFAVMCEKRRIPYMFVPELSRTVASRPEVKPFLEERGFTGRELFLDTGFAGSIPRSLAAHFPGVQFKFRLMSQNEQFVAKVVDTNILVDQEPGKGKPPRRALQKERWKRYPNQLFPNRKTARDEALYQEYVAKFWRSGTFAEPMKAPPLGHAPSVFKEWLHKPNIWRYDDAKARVMCLTDGKDAVSVSLSDAKIAPGFYEWWKSLPKGPVWTPPNYKPGEIVQYLSDKRSIQRAALLTSQLWRGIPYWKTMTVAKPAPFKITEAVGPGIVNALGAQTITFNSASTSTTSITSSNSTANFIIAGGNGWMPVPNTGGAFGLVSTEGPGEVHLEVTKAQLDLFEKFPVKKAEPTVEENGQLKLFAGKPSQAFKVAAKVINGIDGSLELLKAAEGALPGECNCGPEEACADCPNDKVMTFQQFQAIAI